jgi:hypothetical protein
LAGDEWGGLGGGHGAGWGREGAEGGSLDEMPGGCLLVYWSLD